MVNHLAIIILNYNNYQQTTACVQNLLELEVTAEIVVIDNGSSNDSYNVLNDYYAQHQSVHVIKSENNVGYAAGNNIGVRYVKTELNYIEYVCIMNPDTRITYGNIFDHLISKLEAREDIAVIAPMNLLEGQLNLNHVWWDIPDVTQLVRSLKSTFKMRNSKEYITVDREGVAKVDVVPGSLFVISMDDFLSVQLFDEGTFLYNEEIILAIRLKEKGKGEALSIGDYYFHCHQQRELTLKDRLSLAKVNYDSRKFLSQRYYNNAGCIRINIVYMYNICYAYYRSIRHRIKKIILR